MDGELEQYRRRLPQWRLKGSVYFATWRLASTRTALDAQMKDVIQECLLHFRGQRYDLYAYSVMNDHVHAIVRPLEHFELSKIIHTWKPYTAHQINRLRGLTGMVWQDESMTRIIRSEDELNQKLEYVLTNPQRRWPDAAEYEWVGWFVQQ